MRMTNKAFAAWQARGQRRATPEWKRRRKVTAARLSPRKARDHKAARLLRGRRQYNAAVADQAAHIRAITWFGSDGDRCPDCGHIPMHPWEKLSPWAWQPGDDSYDPPQDVDIDTLMRWVNAG